MNRKIAILVVLALLTTTGFVYAASVNGTFAGLPIVNVKVNGETLKPAVPGVVLQGRTMLPARAIAESLDAVVSWDQATMTATVTKPDVNMVFVDEITIENDGSWTLSNVGRTIHSLGKDKWSYIYYTVGPMPKQLYSFRVALTSPEGEILKTSDIFEYVIDETGLMGQVFMEDITYQKPGNYVYKFQIKFNNQFETVESSIVIVE